MNAKTLITTVLAAMLAMTDVEIALADVSVTDVKVQPRSPWNGLVDIEYTVACDDPQTDVHVHPVAYDGDRRMTLFMNCLTGEGADGAVRAGKHKMTWDASKDYGVFSSANFQVKIYAGKRMPRYIKIDLSSGAESEEYPIEMSVEGPDLSNDACRTTELWLRLVLPGEFWMGSPKDELGRTDNEDLHHVTLTKPFYMGVFEVTQKQYELVMGANPSTFKGTDNAPLRPVETVRWDQIRGVDDPASNTMTRDSFLTRLRTRTHSLAFDLPSEARWEYACRAGTTTALYNEKNLSSVDNCAALNEIARNFANGWSEIEPSVSNQLYGTATVGSYKPNRLGFHDMLGNVWEICRDGAGATAVNMNDSEIAALSLGQKDVVDPLITAYRNNTNDAYHYIIRGAAYDSRANVCRGSRRLGKLMHDNWSSTESYTYTKGRRRVGFRICSELEF